MVTKRGFGSALVQKPDKVTDILENVIPKIDIPLSIKCRLGFENANEIYALIEVLNQFPIKELTVHTRTAKQMYKGKTNPEAFNDIRTLCQHKLVYNGDINSLSDLEQHYNLFEQNIDRFMLGRGLLMNPFLASEIKGKQYKEDDKREILKQFHNELFEISKEKLEPSHLLSRMISHWEYLSFIFEDQRKVFKAIKKIKRIDKYEILIDQLMLKQKLSD
jgi:tRNA-dihydrouridine synthase